MKKKLLFMFASLVSLVFFSQSDNGFSYQSILRDNNGTPVGNQDLYIEIEITQGANGISLYEESHNVTTNFVGIINLIIGSGTSSDNISNILWDNPPYFMEVYVNDGTGLQLISSSEILNVPIAMYAKYGKDEDSDTTNEYNTAALLNGNNLEIVDAGGTLTVDLSSLQVLSGTDDQNIVGSGLSGDTLTIGIEGGSSQTIDLSTIKGTDDQNIFNSGLVGSALTIGIEGGNSQTVDLSSLIGSDNQTAFEVVSSQTTNISAINVDDAIAELANEKFDVLGGLMYGDINMNSNNLNFIGTATANTFSGELNGTINTSTIAITQPIGDNSNKIATTQYVDLSTSAAGGTDDQNIVGSGLSGYVLTIGIEGGSSQTIDLSTIIGTDDQNIFNSGLVGSALTIGIEGGNSQTIDLSSLIGSDNQTASQVVSNAAGNLGATTVQSALEELDIETTLNTAKIGITSAQASDIITNTATGANNAAAITTNVTNIGTNTSNIATNSSGIATNVTAIGTNTTNNTGLVTVHSDVSSAGSGNIISVAERTAIGTNTSNIATNTSGIATNVTAIGTNTTNNTGLVTVHSDVSSAGSGNIISAAERTAIGTNTTAIAGAVMNTGAQSIAGSKTFTSAIVGNVNGNVTGDLNGTINTSTIAITQPVGDNSNKIATTNYVDRAVVEPSFSMTTTTASYSIDTDLHSVGIIRALATPININAPTGTPTNGQELIFRIKDNGTGKTITWSPVFIDCVGLPLGTTANKVLYIICRYNAESSSWDIISIAEEK